MKKWIVLGMIFLSMTGIAGIRSLPGYVHEMPAAQAAGLEHSSKDQKMLYAKQDPVRQMDADWYIQRDLYRQKMLYEAAPEGQDTPSLTITSPSALLMEADSGMVLYEKDADTARRPASVTKLMTMLLSFEALDAGRLKLTDPITVSKHASDMGGSQVYLEPGEVQTVQDLLKCMIVSSANDAAVAMAEAIAGSEEDFVARMNERAVELGMTNTHFENACGLEAAGHLMSARDIGILSRELLLKHPEVTDYTTIWMDTITHRTKRGESEFGLANTNKFLKKYEGANGLKTGYTSAAGFSMSATACRNGITLIAVVMGSSTKDIRYADAAALLNYGFANCTIYRDEKVLDGNDRIQIAGGISDEVLITAESAFQFPLVGRAASTPVAKELTVLKSEAPVTKGEVVARMDYYQNGTLLGSVNLCAAEDVEKQTYRYTLQKLFLHYLNSR